MQTRFKIHVQNHFPELESGRLLLAVSGGIDSVVLMHLCMKSQLDFAVAHCNFHLRGEDSNGDQQFVEDLAKKMNATCFVAEFDTNKYAETNKMSIQLAARKLRYDWFNQLLDNHGFDYLLTAHHLDDSMETFLINLSRGTGIEGLLGIPEQNGKIRRPLLNFSREEIAEYAVQNQIEWREDYTNAQTKYLRNRIRKDILPLLKGVNNHFEQSFQNTISHLKEVFKLSQEASELRYKEVVTERGEYLYFAIEKIKKLSHPKAYLYQWLQPYGFTAWKDIENLLEADSGKKIYAQEYVLLKNRNELILRSTDVQKSEEKIYYLEENTPLVQPLKISVEPYKKSALETGESFILIDGDTVKFPLIVRKRRNGDSFKPIGMSGSKKVSKYFKDEKFSQFDKENIWLLCSEGKIVWIIGNRMDERFKVKNTTTKILKIQLTT